MGYSHWDFVDTLYTGLQAEICTMSFLFPFTGTLITRSSTHRAVFAAANHITRWNLSLSCKLRYKLFFFTYSYRMSALISFEIHM